jgi:hypothetical protein
MTFLFREFPPRASAAASPGRWLSCARRRGLSLPDPKLAVCNGHRLRDVNIYGSVLPGSPVPATTAELRRPSPPVHTHETAIRPAARRAVAVYLGRQDLVRTKGTALCELLMTARRRCRRRGCSAISGTHEAGIRTGSETRCARPASLGASRPSPHSGRSIDLAVAL